MKQDKLKYHSSTSSKFDDGLCLLILVFLSSDFMVIVLLFSFMEKGQPFLSWAPLEVVA